MNKAVFLDRDGVLNDGTLYYTYRIEDFTINQGVIDGLLLLQQSGFKLIVITNQSGVAKGQYSELDVQNVHSYMQQEFAKHNLFVTDIYYCPHHSSISNCNCRKPGTLLFEQAIQKHSIDVSKSYMIGDSDRDIVAAQAMNIKGIRIQKNENIVPYCKAIIENKI